MDQSEEPRDPAKRSPVLSRDLKIRKIRKPALQPDTLLPTDTSHAGGSPEDLPSSSPLPRQPGTVTPIISHLRILPYGNLLGKRLPIYPFFKLGSSPSAQLETAARGFHSLT